jgi:hypothetical protein
MPKCLCGFDFAKAQMKGRRLESYAAHIIGPAHGQPGQSAWLHPRLWCRPELAAAWLGQARIRARFATILGPAPARRLRHGEQRLDHSAQAPTNWSA